MKIRFSLAWLKAGQPVSKAFKSSASYLLLHDYLSRISRFIPCEAVNPASNPRSVLWVCERDKKSRMLSSEDLAKELSKVMNSGAQELQVLVGSSDGFTAKQLEEMKPALKWSFGPLTLPHELAAVVASEQIYRALTILQNHPYHSGH
ncbi:MAG: Ribosomal RNA large subunit methyltransferase H [Candidatus Omnitrophica bacterium ADurb.Bin277]|nr:MAG: Ribosomal RNA large subunit methyltransferase H [Candidatus Omnitrophica bacterium ADurb.Bin277]